MEIENIINQNPLIDHKISLVNDSEFEKVSSSIYLGTGLCDSKEMSIGIPFDILSMIFIAENIKRELNLDKVYHNIADIHAKSNGFSGVDRIAKTTKDTICKIVNNFGFDNYDIKLSSETYDEEYQEIISRINCHQDYIVNEIADIEFFRKKGANIKVGWGIKTDSLTKYDEQMFDREYMDFFNKPINFIYSCPGKRLNDKAPNAAPYILTFKEKNSRIEFDINQNIKKKIIDSQCRKDTYNAFKKHMNSICREYSKLVENIDGNSVDEKIEYIIQRGVQ